MAEATSAPQLITQIQVGVQDDKVVWTLEYQTGETRAVGLHLPVAQQFVQALTAAVAALEEAQARHGAQQSGMGLGDTATVRLSPPGDS